jgi:hypothetical protein
MEELSFPVKRLKPPASTFPASLQSLILVAVRARAHIAPKPTLRDEAMLPVLIAIRDLLVSMALAWVGVTVETQHAQADHAGCAVQNCAAEAQHH